MSYGREASPSGGGGKGVRVSVSRPNTELSMLSQHSLASGSRKSPMYVVSYGPVLTRKQLTFYKSRHKAMCATIHQSTLAGNTDGRQNVVASHHDCADIRIQQLLDHACGGGFELVLEDDEADEIEIALYFSTSHLLSLDPAQLLQVSSSAGNDTIPLVGVERKPFFIVLGNCSYRQWPVWIRGEQTRLQVSGLQISRIASGAPLTKMSPLRCPNLRTMTLALRSCETNSNDLSTPSSKDSCFDVSVDHTSWMVLLHQEAEQRTATTLHAHHPQRHQHSASPR